MSETLINLPATETQSIVVYQEESRKTAHHIPTDITSRMGYLGVGYFDEMIEFWEKATYKEYTVDDLVFELGDALWYLSQIIDELDWSFEFITHQALKYLRANEPIVPHYKLLPQLISRSGSFAGALKKYYRDAHNRTEQEEILHECLVQLVSIYLHITDNIGVTFYYVLNSNLKKLRKRQQAGTVKGSGDYR